MGYELGEGGAAEGRGGASGGWQRVVPGLGLVAWRLAGGGWRRPLRCAEQEALELAAGVPE